MNINEIVEQAVKKEASDIHLTVNEKPMYRIGNALIKMECESALKFEDMNELYNYFTKGNTALKYVMYEHNGVNFDVNLSSSKRCPVYTMKVIKNDIPQYEELDLPECLRKSTHQRQGLILITGNKKSGKTTTLNALVRHINETQNRKIITLEKTIEYNHVSRNSLVIQKEVGYGRDFNNYTEGIENSLREDCDVLIVEDIRNKETMENVLKAVEEGQLVIAGLNTESCVDAIDKMINFYDKKEQNQIKYELAELLKLIISQKLLLGTNAKFELLTEVMVVDDKIREILRYSQNEIVDLKNEMQNCKQNGNISRIYSLANLYSENKITLKQAKSLLEKKDIDSLNNTIMKMRIK